MNDWTSGRFWKNLIIVRNRAMFSKDQMDKELGQQEKTRRTGVKSPTELQKTKQLILQNGKRRSWQVGVFNGDELSTETKDFSAKDLEDIEVLELNPFMASRCWSNSTKYSECHMMPYKDENGIFLLQNNQYVLSGNYLLSDFLGI